MDQFSGLNLGPKPRMPPSSICLPPTSQPQCFATQTISPMAPTGILLQPPAMTNGIRLPNANMQLTGTNLPPMPRSGAPDGRGSPLFNSMQHHVQGNIRPISSNQVRPIPSPQNTLGNQLYAAPQYSAQQPRGIFRGPSSVEPINNTSVSPNGNSPFASPAIMTQPRMPASMLPLQSPTLPPMGGSMQSPQGLTAASQISSGPPVHQTIPPHSGPYPPAPQFPTSYPPGSQQLASYPVGPHIQYPSGPNPPRPYNPGQQPAVPLGSQQPSPYQSGPMQNSQVQAAPAPRQALDPDSMPNPITVMAEDQKERGGPFYIKEKGQVPPLVTTKFIAYDQGVASPRFIRSTMYNVPASSELQKQCGIPFGLVVVPLAEVAEGENSPPLSDFGSGGPVRCARCKAYMNPFMQFIDGGRRFQCVFCNSTTEVPEEYFQHLDHVGLRVDRYQRPELCLGTYDCVATKEYCRDSKFPNPPAIIFAIDVSYPMIKDGIVSLICRHMRGMLDQLPKDENRSIPVAFMTYDNTINFYKLNDSEVSQPAQMTIGDVGDVFVPLGDGLFCDIEKSAAALDNLFEQVPQLFAETRETETILGPVIQAAKQAFVEAKCSGKVLIFHHNLPCFDAAPGKLTNRDDRKSLGTDNEKVVLSPQSKFYGDLAVDCVKVGCSVDVFLFNNAYVDVATINQICRLTGGQLYKYTYFQCVSDGLRFLTDLRHNLTRPTVFDAIMRIRTSTGIRPVDFFGSFYMANTTDIEMAAVNSDLTVACEIKHDDKLGDDEGVYVQVALLFTAYGGKRRLRVINLSLNSTSQLTEIFKKCDLDTVINFVSKQSINRLMETSGKSVREGLISNCAHTLACYRKHCTNTVVSGQLILPECMKLYPIYVNCLIKSDVLSGGPDLGCDDRAFLMSTLSSMDLASSVAFFYPRLMSLHNVDVEETCLPALIRCTADKIKEEGVYLMDNGLMMFIYVGSAVNSSWLQDVFAVPTSDQIDIEQLQCGPSLRDNPMSRRVGDIMDLVRGERKRFSLRTAVIRQYDKTNIVFRHFLCEDKSGGSSMNFSYVDFLCHIHKEIRALLNNSH